MTIAPLAQDPPDFSARESTQAHRDDTSRMLAALRNIERPLYAVADGIGGLAGGAEAAEEAVTQLLAMATDWRA